MLPNSSTRIEYRPEPPFDENSASANHETESPAAPSSDNVPSDPSDFFGFEHEGQWMCLSRDERICPFYSTSKTRSPKIIGESNSLEIDVFPWSILITDNKQTKTMCSGVLISSRNVLTSGFCARKIFAGLSTADAAVGGVNDFQADNRDDWDVKILERRYYHPEYK